MAQSTLSLVSQNCSISHKICIWLWCALLLCGYIMRYWVNPVYCPGGKVHGANMGPTWVLSAPDGPHVGNMNLAIRVVYQGWLDVFAPIPILLHGATDLFWWYNFKTTSHIFVIFSMIDGPVQKLPDYLIIFSVDSVCSLHLLCSAI